MDINKYIDDNLDNIVEIYSNNNDFDESIDILKENNTEYGDNDNDGDDYLYQYGDNIIDENSLQNDNLLSHNDEKLSHNDENSYYYLNLLNIFLKYYNDKYNKCDNFFSGIIDRTKDTSSQMELFFEVIIEYKQLKEILNENSDDKIMKLYFDDNKKEQLNIFLDNYNGQIYKLEINDTMIYSPSLLICLNFILDNFDYLNINWTIFNLRNL